jgi:hypothetical protein
MNETTLVLDESHASTSTEKDAASRTYKALPRRPGQPNFMDFFAPRRRPPIDQNLPKYKALARPPAGLSGVERTTTPEIQEASADQSSEETGPHGKEVTQPVATECAQP